MSRLRVVVLLLLCSGAAVSARAQTTMCAATAYPAEPVPDINPLASGLIVLESGTGDIRLGGPAELSGGVTVRKDSYMIEADRGIYEPDTKSLSLLGDIEYRGGGAAIGSDSATLSYLFGSIEFKGAKFQLGDGAARGEAGLFEINQAGRIRLRDVGYTSCPPGDDDWLITARKITLNTREGYGEARGLRLDFQGVPILYSPYLSFPISRQRKTGFLLPNVGQSSINGLDISTPWYWNIDPQYDLTVSPRFLSKRGVLLDSRFRYLTRTSRGALQAAFLPGDDVTGTNRQLVSWQNTTDFAQRWRASADVTDVSDSNYLEDLGGSLSSASPTHLNRSVALRYPGRTWDVLATAQAYQTIDDMIAPEDRPYRLLPRLVANGYWPGIAGLFEARLDSELTNFDRDVGATGWRMHAQSSLSLPLAYRGLYMTPRVDYRHTRYSLEREAGDTADEDITRTLPSVSLDLGARLERRIGNGDGLIQTIEPRLFYVHVPFRDQDDIPVFDTIRPDASLEQLFRPDRFIGPDRIIDTDQVTVGVTSRLISAADGKSLLTATLGQTRFLSEQAVTLPGTETNSGNSSDWIAELGMNLYGNWNLDMAQQWSSERSETTKSELRLQYVPGGRRVVNLAYRYRRSSIEQGDISWSWPIADRWNVVGRYNYSFRDKTSLERFFGVEYESCCWGVRVVSRRYISRRDGTADTSIAIQLELKGLTSVGDPADRLLERGILGYTRDRD